jgi:hypothetical protein
MLGFSTNMVLYYFITYISNSQYIIYLFCGGRQENYIRSLSDKVLYHSQWNDSDVCDNYMEILQPNFLDATCM